MKIFKDQSFTQACGDTIAYGFYGRTGGVSEGVYSSLNCQPFSKDDPDAVQENRRKVTKDFRLDVTALSTLSQCHSADCLLIDRAVPQGAGTPVADGLVTDKPGLIIGALTADCGPVLFVGEKQGGAPVIGAAHAGWGGALKGILEDTIAKMVQAQARIETIRACVGPCIGPASYEVRDEFMRPFVIRDEEAEHFFKSGQKDGHMMFDMPGYIAMRLSMAGIKQISLMGIDTYKDEEHCFSYRRATHRGEGDYGRQIAAIAING